STARSAIRLASSWIVIASGIVTSRTSFSFGSLLFSEVRRCTRRRNEASERSRTSSALMAVTSVSRPRGRSVAVLAAGVGRCGGGRGRLGGRRRRRCALGDRRYRSRSRSLGLAVGAKGAALLDLDDHLLAAAMAEALAHHARLCASLERQSGLHAQRLA